MAPAAQQHIFQAMSAPDFYPHPVFDLHARETHISRVFLTGEYVYKLKKAVKLDFLDYSTLAKRKALCFQELKLNRRLAPDVYIDVLPITRKGTHLYLDGPGNPVEYAVKMRQLPDENCLKQRLRHKRVDAAAMDDLARRLSSFYRAAATGPKIDRFGSIATIRANCEENFRQLNQVPVEILRKENFLAVQAATRAYLLRCGARFEDRIRRGKIRDCHGDLRSDHVYFDDGLQIIDCIEFNDRFRYADIICDLAFLAMDLEYEGHPALAQNLVDAYVRYSKDAEIFLLLDFYKCYRALVRSKIRHLMLQGLPEDDFSRKRMERDIRHYLSLAFRYAVRFTRPTLYVVCGLPASGKSTIADQLSATLHIDVLRSDRIRKLLFGMTPETPADVPFQKGIYSPGSTALTYGKLFLMAQEILEKGKAVLLDATFSREHQRREALQLARDMEANILFIECWAPLELLEHRLKDREPATSLSDARHHHLKGMLSNYKPFDTMDNQHHIRVDTQEAPRENLQKILSHDYCLLSSLDRWMRR